MANVKISGLTAYTDPVATDVLPIVDLVNDQTKKVKVEDLLKKFGLGTEALPSFAFTGDLDTGIYSPGANQFAVTTGGTQRLLIDASGNTTIQGDLTVNGTTTTVSSNTLSIKDKNIEIAVVSTPTDTTADGGGITLKGATDKTLTWVNSTDCWTFNQALNLTTGTAGAPALVFNGDVNSGLFQPGADSLAIATGGAQRVTVDSSGRLLMGTSSAVLDTSNALVQLAASAGANMVLYRDNSSVSNADSLGLIRFYSNAGSSKQEHGRITCIADGASGANDKPGALLFYTTADGASSPTERFRVDSSGRMLLGTTNAVAFGSRQVLAVANGTTGGVISLYNSTTATANTRISSNPTGSEINDIGIHAASTNGSIIAYTNNDTERMRIDSSGRVGIGVSSLIEKLEVDGNIVLGPANAVKGASSTGTLQIQGGATNPGGNILFGGGSGTDDIRFRTTGASTSSTERMRIDSSGTVIVKAASADKGIELEANGSRVARFGVLNPGVEHQVYIGTLLGNSFCFRTNNTERMRIDTSGNVGIGTTSPTHELTVHNASSTAGTIEANRFSVRDNYGNVSGLGNGFVSPAANTLAFATNSTERMRIDSSGRLLLNGGSDVRIELGTNGTTGTNDRNHIRGDGSSLKYNTCSGGLHVFEQNGTERMRIDSAGRVGIGTTSPVQALHVAVASNDVARFESTTSNGSATIELKPQSSSGRARIDVVDNAADFSISTVGKSDALLISNGGNVGIGTTSPYSASGYNSLTLNGSTGSQIRFRNNDVDRGLIYNNSSSFNIYSMAGIPLVFTAGAAERMRIESGGASKFSGTIAPSADNTHNVGGSSLRWSAIYAVNGTIQTSDQREKTNVLDSSLGFDFVKSLRPVSYKWINGGQVETGVNNKGELQYTSNAGQRTHWGFIAQEVKQSIDDAGVDFGGWVLTDKDDPSSQQALRYDQFIAPLTKALQETIAKIETLEQRLSDAGIA